MWYNFPYFEISPVNHGAAFPTLNSILRPALKVALRSSSVRYSLLATVDSGADFCLFPLFLVDHLGLNIDEAKLIPNISGYGSDGGEDVPFWSLTMEIENGPSLSTMVGFSARQKDFGLLGQRGFFSEFEQINFSHRGQCFSIKAAEPANP